jgi:sulfate permease, SulP family
LGFLADFLSRTVLVGFLTGVGFQVGIAMLGDMLGVSVNTHNTLAQAWEILRRLPISNLPTLALSTLVTGSILLGHRIAPRFPLSLFAAIGTIAASAEFHFVEQGIAVIGAVPGGLPAIGLPNLTLREALTRCRWPLHAL